MASGLREKPSEQTPDRRSTENAFGLRPPKARTAQAISTARSCCLFTAAVRSHRCKPTHWSGLWLAIRNGSPSQASSQPSAGGKRPYILAAGVTYSPSKQMDKPNLEGLRKVAAFDVNDEAYTSSGGKPWRVTGRYWSPRQQSIVYDLAFPNGVKLKRIQEGELSLKPPSRYGGR